VASPVALEFSGAACIRPGRCRGGSAKCPRRRFVYSLAQFNFVVDAMRNAVAFHHVATLVGVL
jgi:hypothetical protein